MKVLIAVDATRSSKAILYTFYNLVRKPDEIVLLHVSPLEGNSMMIDMLGDAELKTLRESMNGTEHKEKLDRKSGEILQYYKKQLEEGGAHNITTVTRDGHSAEEILKVAEEQHVDMIILGYHKKAGLSRLISGSVMREVEKGARMPVLLAKTPPVCEEPYTWRDAYYAISLAAVVVVVFFLVGMILEKHGALLP